nr:DUF4422 domain-containing protein [Gluconobacter kondonii]
MLQYQDPLGIVHIYVCHHTTSFTFEDDVFLPIQVGRALADNHLPIRGDDTGDNISKKNREYCELTALYWAWKNDKDAAWIGFMHYRRFLDFACTGLQTDSFGCISLKNMTPLTLQQMGLNAEIVRKTIEDTPSACAILPEKWSVRNVNVSSLYQHYANSDYHFARDLDLTRSVISDLYPDDLPVFDVVMAGDEGYFTNVFVFRRDLFDTYCGWLFSILSEVEARADLTNYSAQARRIYGYLGERLFNVFMSSSRAPTQGVIKRTRCFFEKTKMENNDVMPSQNLSPPGLNAVTIVTAADENFVPHLAALLESIKASFSPERFLDMIVLDGGISSINKNLLKRQFHINLSQDKARITFLNCQGMHSDIRTHMHFSTATFYRLSLGQLLPNHPRALYIDCDTIVLSNLCQLWDTPLDGAIIAATPDLIMKNFVNAGIHSMQESGALPASLYLREYLDMGDYYDNYFQAGVILFDLDAFRNSNVASSSIRDLSRKCYWFLDQDILNKYLKNRVKIIDTSWNCVNSIREILPYLSLDWKSKALEDLNNPKIVHYAGFEAKPWNNHNAPLSFFYWFFLRKTFWYETVIYKQTFSENTPVSFHDSMLRQVLTRGWHFLPQIMRRPLRGVAVRIKRSL